MTTEFPTTPIDPAHLARLRADRSIVRMYLMEGDGFQAPGAVIHRSVDGKHSIHFANLQVGGWGNSDYDLTAAEAMDRYAAVCKRSDPTGWLHKAAIRALAGDITVRNCPPTPWGAADNVERLADGIWFVSTPSHGGILVSAERHDAMPAELRQVNYSGLDARWFEEDCDWALVAVAFPDAFPAKQIAKARRTIDDWKPALAAKYGTAAATEEVA